MKPAPVIKTTCPYCGVGCGVAVTNGEAVAGDPDHPANYGRLCSKGSALGETLGLDGRLLEPRIQGAPASWDAALDLIAARFSETIAAHGPDAVAFYVSGQLLTEDYYVANKLMKGFLGAANIDTNSRLCMASSVAGHKRAFGEDLVPGTYEDFDQADLVVLTGSNAAWCHPVLYQRLLRAKETRGTRLVVIDPRRTASCEGADLHLSIASGTDVLLFNGLLAYLARDGALDRAYMERATVGFDAALHAARRDAGDLAHVALRCGVREDDLETFYRWFAQTKKSITAYSQGVNQSTRGADKVNAIINCHLATGRIGLPGSGPFSLTGQPNAMGGREVGGLANQLAAHMSFESREEIDRVRRFWNAPRIATAPGLKAVEMFEAVATGRIKALWIMGTNPAVSMPDAGRVRAALAACPFVVVSDCVAETDTTAYADVLLPAASWGEKDGTVTNSDRTISRQRPFRAPPGSAMPDWWIVSAVAARMGHGAAFAYDGAADIFREHAQLSAFENDGARMFDLGALAALDQEGYDALEPVAWPVTSAAPHGRKRLCADGVFPAADGRAQFVAVSFHEPAAALSARRPLILNTGRVRDHWHTMARTGAVARLSAHAPEPALALNSADARRLGITADGLVRIESDYGDAIARAAPSADIPPGMVFLPMHWNDRFTAHCVADRLVNPYTDGLSGQPELKHTPVSIAPIVSRWTAFLLTRKPIAPARSVYWARHAVAGGSLYELAGTEAPETMRARWHDLVATAPEDEVIEYCDARRGVLRLAVLNGGILTACLFAGPEGSLPAREGLASLFAADAPLDEAARAALLSGRGADERAAFGRTICACFNVGLTAILTAIRDEAISDVKTLGLHLRAGTNCGSCVSELKEILRQDVRMAAE